MSRTSKKVEFKPKQVTEAMLSEYLAIAETVRELEKKKDELRASILFAFPEGGSLGNYMLFIEEQDRRSFPLDEVKACVDESTWMKVYVPFIKITTSLRLLIKKV